LIPDAVGSIPDPIGPDSIGIVVPAHNEQQLLPGCLRSLLAAAAQVPVPVRVVVALDRCTDGSAGVVASFADAGVRAVRSQQPGVGSARAVGVTELLATGSADRLWLATTDADSEVPPDWLVRQLAHARRGAEAVIGTVRVLDWSDQPAGVPARFAARYRPEFGHRHQHGANLAFTASSYLRAGGFASLDRDEDVDLIGRLEALGCALVWAADLPVTTSARRDGRAPAGFAGYLAGLAEVADDVS